MFEIVLSTPLGPNCHQDLQKRLALRNLNPTSINCTVVKHDQIGPMFQRVRLVVNELQSYCIYLPEIVAETMGYYRIESGLDAQQNYRQRRDEENPRPYALPRQYETGTVEGNINVHVAINVGELHVRFKDQRAKDVRKDRQWVPSQADTGHGQVTLPSYHFARRDTADVRKLPKPKPKPKTIAKHIQGIAKVSNKVAKAQAKKPKPKPRPSKAKPKALPKPNTISMGGVIDLARSQYRTVKEKVTRA